MIRACFLPAGNDTEHPYPLSIHAAWMLLDGIRQYAQSTRQLFEQGMEDACYSSIRVQTAIKQATKLREWLVALEPDYLADTITDVDALLAELTSDQDRFAALLEVEPGHLQGTINNVDALLADLFAEGRATEGDDLPPEMDR